ncbi:MAG: SdpI family protein [Nanoarchaeota archaeon]|nr:SdpI family protein [Nanoarchaeota archaeon]
MKKAIFIIILAFAVSLAFYPYVPDMMATHWDATGNVNGYMSRPWGLFMMPVMLAGLVLLFSAIPNIDPLKANIKKFKKQYDTFIIVFSLFMLFIHIHVLLWNVGIMISTNLIVPFAVSILFFYLGMFLKDVKRNYFIGIRTPWTLANDNVWNKTHMFGSKLFMISGIVVLSGVFFREYVIYFIMVPTLLSSLVLVVYSYFVWKKKS